MLQNLIVVSGARGLYEVCAGGRRLEALTVLAQADDIPENYPVPVLIVPAEKALIASLAENVFHIPMNPADEHAAFAKLIGAGKSVEDVAAAFSVTPLVVKRRMELAAVSPSLMAQFREGQIGLDCLMVLTRRVPSGEEADAMADLQTRLDSLHGQMDALQDHEGDDENDDREFLKHKAEGEVSWS